MTGAGVFLVVDDDEVFRAALARALTRRGYTVHVAGSVEEAGAIGALTVDCAVVDLKLPDGSGLEVVQDLHGRWPDARILVLTGYASIATAVEAVKLGAVNYLMKPATAGEILHALAQTGGDAGVAIAEEPASVSRLEWEHIQRVLAEHDGNISATARALNMHRRTLQRKLAKRPKRR